MHCEIVEGNTTLAFSFGLGVFFACLLGREERLWPTMVAAVLGPLFSMLFLILKPLNPYEGNMYAKLEGVSLVKVRRVTGAQALVDLLKSRAARVYVSRVAAFSALALVILLPFVWLTLRSMFPMTGRSRILDQVIIGSFMFGVSTFGVEAMLLLRWAVQRVRQQEFPEL
jgi:hypothetical protein